MGVLRGCMSLVALTIALFQSADAQDEGPQKIVGGEPAVVGRSWMVRFQAEFVPLGFCGGSLISPTWILTAAHCIGGDVEVFISDVIVRIGPGIDQEDPSQFVTGNVSNVIVHPNYNSVTADNDIALVQLAEPVSLTPIRLNSNPCLTPPDVTGIPVSLLGWGATNDTDTSEQSPTLNLGLMQTFNTTLCLEEQRNTDDTVKDFPQAICFQGTNPASGTPMSCGGDSGGPYFVGDFDTAVQIGVVSFGPFNQSCNTNQALYNRDIASRVSYFYNFIKTIATDLPPQCGPLYLGPAVDTCDCGNQRPGETCTVKCAPNAYCAHGGRSKATFACVNGPYGPKWVGHKPDCRLWACHTKHGLIPVGTSIVVKPAPECPIGSWYNGKAEVHCGYDGTVTTNCVMRKHPVLH